MKINILRFKCFAVLINIIFIIIFCSFPMPYHIIFYENVEFPVWMDAYGIWSYEDEKIRLVYGYYSTEAIFNFLNEPVILQFTLTVNGVDGLKTGKVTFRLNPIEKHGVIEMPY